MGGSERSSSYRSRHRSKSRERERSRDHKSSRDKDYEYSHSRRSSKKSKHSKKSSKYHRRSRSSSRSSDSSSSSHTSKYSNSRRSKTRAPSTESNNSRSALTTSSTSSTSAVKGIDLMDLNIQTALETIEEDSFQPRTFFSTKDREAPEKPANSEKVIIDLNAQTVTFPKPVDILTEASTKDEIFHPNFLGDPDHKQEKWIRKLLMYRQKYMTE